MSKIIGIDLGTTNSCVAVRLNNEVKIIENEEGKRTTPSIVSYNEEETVVGVAAQRQRVTNPENTIYAVKRLIGRKFSDKIVQEDVERMPYQIVEHSNGDAWVSVNGQPLSPQQVSAEILKKMKKTAEKYLGEEVTEAVITVPAYFNDSQRQATKDAGKIAGLEVKRIINEPTAAALAYGMDNQKGDRVMAVYDLGGGTFDISIIEMNDIDGEKSFEVLSTNGDTYLGGEDFDNALFTYITDQFKQDKGVDLTKDSIATQRIKQAAEEAKVELSTAEQTSINIPYVSANEKGPVHLDMKITRAKLEALVSDLVKRTFEAVKGALSDADVLINDVDDILLVGGQTRMPLVQREVENFFGKAPRTNVNPDEAVASGAAIQGGVLSGDVNDVLLLDVTPLSLGLETAGGVMTKIVEKNTTIPTQGSQVFSTAEDNQNAVTIHVLQGERSQASQNKSLGQFNLEGIRPARRGEPQIEVSFDINADGILTVSAKDKDTGKEQKITIKSSSGLTEEEIERMVQDAEANSEKDKEFEEFVKLSNEADHVISYAEKEISEPSQELKDAIETLSKAKEDKDASLMKENIEKVQRLIQESLQKAQQQEASNETSQADNQQQDEDIVDAEYEEVKDEDNK
tara:strand:+ start:19035 stop:20921 length:1887 start_codon:yes stop_codon:yes gene_type:complete